MGQEIERRFILSGYDAAVLKALPSKAIAQGYLEVRNPSESFRVRISPNEWSTTIKRDRGLGGVVRDEDEWDNKRDGLPYGMVKRMMDICDHRLEKDRHFYPRTQDRNWEIDVFAPPLAGIVLAECEMSSPSEPVVIPEWFGTATEVTNSLTNLHLARLSTDLRGTSQDPLPLIQAHLARRIRRIVVTGGPGSGKTGLMETIRSRYPDVHVIPEVATIIIAQLGIVPDGTAVGLIRMQRAIWRTQKIFEMTSVQYAASIGKKAVILDRGSVDNAAYLGGGIREMERRYRTSLASEYANYDEVIWLDTPPEDIYQRIKANNVARTETWEQAKRLGETLYEVWSYHPRFNAVRVSGDDWAAKEGAALAGLDAAMKS